MDKTGIHVEVALDKNRLSYRLENLTRSQPPTDLINYTLETN